MRRDRVSRSADGSSRPCRCEYPDIGLYHPGMPERIGAHVGGLPAPVGKPLGVVGLVILRSYVLAEDSGHYDGVIEALEARGLRVLPVFAGGLDARPRD